MDHAKEMVETGTQLMKGQDLEVNRKATQKVTWTANERANAMREGVNRRQSSSSKSRRRRRTRKKKTKKKRTGRGTTIVRDPKTTLVAPALLTRRALRRRVARKS